jgi:esterase/lipase superfamily enzyme
MRKRPNLNLLALASSASGRMRGAFLRRRAADACPRLHVARLLAAILFTIGFSVPLPAATIEGRVVVLGGQPALGLIVTATNVRTGFGAIAIPQEGGKFSLSDLPLGSYYVAVESPNYPDRTLHKQVVRLDQDTIAPLTITIRLGGFGFNPSSESPGSPLVPPRPKNYATVSLLYGTDRKPASTEPDRAVFGTERGELVVGVCNVSIPRDHRVGELESPRVWKLEFRPDPSKHIVLLDTASMSQEEFRALLQQRIAKSDSRESLVFIPGYNVSFEDAARRTAQIAYDLGFRGVASFYSWPSNGKVLDYLFDEEQARRAVRYLVAYLEVILSDKDIDQVHLIAHSMGNQVLTAALQQFAARLPTGGRPRIGQIALVAPDIDAEVFRTEIAPRIVGMGHRLTLYASNRDKALEVSRTLHNYPRAGDLRDAVTIVSGMDTIDASAVDTSFVGHSYFAENRSVIADLFSLLRKDADPSERFGMRAMTAAGLRYWMFVP